MISALRGMAAEQVVLRRSAELLGRQVSTGQRSTVFGDLGAEGRRAIDLGAEIGRRETYSNVLGRAMARGGAMQQALDRMEVIAREIAAETMRARTLGTPGADALAARARSALEEVAGLMNLRHGDEYVFAGSAIAVAPVLDGAGIATGAMATRIAAAVATLDPANAGTVLAETADAAVQDTPFSAFLEDPATGLVEAPRTLVAADGERVAYGVFANRDSAGEVAGSWGRELLRSLATVAAMTQATAAQGTGWQALLQGVEASLSGAARGLATEQAALGAAEARMGAVQDRHQDLLVALRTQLGEVQEVDLATAVTRLKEVEARLEASYQATALISRLSLADFLR